MHRTSTCGTATDSHQQPHGVPVTSTPTARLMAPTLMSGTATNLRVPTECIRSRNRAAFPCSVWHCCSLPDSIDANRQRPRNRPYFTKPLAHHAGVFFCARTGNNQANQANLVVGTSPSQPLEGSPAPVSGTRVPQNHKDRY